MPIMFIHSFRYPLCCLFSSLLFQIHSFLYHLAYLLRELDASSTEPDEAVRTDAHLYKGGGSGSRCVLWEHTSRRVRLVARREAFFFCSFSEETLVNLTKIDGKTTALRAVIMLDVQRICFCQHA
jgi:hypothetical protein